jgi:glucose uptake protein
LLKASKKWRFEYFYYDFTLGVLLTVVVAAYTAGSWNSQDLTFQDNYLLAGYRKMAWAMGSGVAFNLGNLLLLGAMTTAGMTLAFPITFAVALAVGAMWQFAVRSDVNGMLTVAGATVMVVAAAVNAVAYAWHLEAEEHKKAKALRADPRAKRVGPPPKSAAKGIMLAAIGGLFMSVFFPALGEATSGDNGVASYGAMILVGAGILGSSIVFVPFFLNFPVQGQPGEVRGYLKGTPMVHLFGLGGGAMWTVAVLASLVAEDAEVVQADPVWVYLLTRGGAFLAAVLGLWVWKEYMGSTMRVKTMLAAMVVMFLAGIALIALAPVYGPTT